MTNQDYTHIAVIADRSGSMRSIQKDMNDGLQTFLEEQAGLPGILTVDVTTFDSEVETPYSDAAVADIKFPIIVPRGMTALLDALGITIVKLGEKLAAQEEEKRPAKVLVMIVTDGQENSSVEYRGRQDDIKAMVEKQQSEFGWTFVFLGANIDSFGVASGFGIPSAHTMDFTASAAGVQNMTRSMSSYATAYRGGDNAEFTEADRENAVKN